jgi:predicted lipid-binding transport protein (Tim44 family)
MQQQNTQTNQNKGGFGRGLAGGLIGGALGGMLFGSLFGAGGSGMGLLPILLLAGVGFFLYRTFARRSAAGVVTNGQPSHAGMFEPRAGEMYRPAYNTDLLDTRSPVEQGLAEIHQSDPHFDSKYFTEVASDVFFQVQAGWVKRDIDAYRHLLGTRLAAGYDAHFAEMRARGHINKLESIAIRRVEVVNAGSAEGEDFVTVLFTANLLDYIVDEKSGELVEGSQTTPVKFAEEWTWARPTGTENWLLEGIKVISE